MDLLSVAPQILVAVGMALAVVSIRVLLRAIRQQARGFRGQIDALQDEIWELREASEARGRAEAANEAKSRFLANVTHEVRTPLNGILGMAELLEGTGLDAEQDTYVAAIRSSGSALASMIDEILDFSKIEAGKIALSRESFDLVGLVEGVTELLAPRAHGKGLEIASTMSTNVPRRVIGDPMRLRQILLNLAGNAVKFTETGGVGLRVALTGDIEPLLRFDVMDTGPGVPADRRTAIFEDFEQVDSSTTQSRGGTGLGLAISKRLAERMGGSLTLEPVGKRHGSSFTLTIPLQADACARLVTPPSPSIDTALIVADSPFEAPFIGNVLADAAVTVTRIKTAEDALTSLADGACFDVVIVDCALGERATRAVAEAARAAGVKQTLVLFSPYERRALGQASALDFDGWLVKPVRRQTLLNLVSRPCAARGAIRCPTPMRQISRRLNVLLAEDNAINALLATRHLERLGASVTHVTDGLAAFDLVEASLDVGKPYDAIVLDIRMPGLDGLDLARRIRRSEHDRDVAPTRVIALTAERGLPRPGSSAPEDIDTVLNKPIDFAGLEAAFEGIGMPESVHA